MPGSFGSSSFEIPSTLLPLIDSLWMYLITFSGNSLVNGVWLQLSTNKREIVLPVGPAISFFKES
jgi:hypothetical protein